MSKTLNKLFKRFEADSIESLIDIDVKSQDTDYYMSREKQNGI